MLQSWGRTENNKVQPVLQSWGPTENKSSQCYNHGVLLKTIKSRRCFNHGVPLKTIKSRQCCNHGVPLKTIKSRQCCNHGVPLKTIIFVISYAPLEVRTIIKAFFLLGQTSIVIMRSHWKQTLRSSHSLCQVQIRYRDSVMLTGSPLKTLIVILYAR